MAGGKNRRPRGRWDRQRKGVPKGIVGGRECKGSLGPQVRLVPSTPSYPPGLTIVHGHWMDGRHRLWVASRVTVTRLGVGGVGRVSTWQDRWLPIAPRRWRARVQGVAVLIGRRGSGIGHGHSRAEGKPQLLGPAIGNKQAVMSSWSLPPPLLPYRLCL